MRATSVGVLMMVATSTLTMSCGRHAYSREHLTEEVAKHHIDLRWGRLGNAALRVKPELRSAFIQAWSLRLQGIELQDMDVLDVAQVDDDTIDVLVSVTYVDKVSMAVRTVQFPERWLRTDQNWQLGSVGELPAG
ncbi:MAG TPA: hypothetical protein VGF99_11905 [Myxococcota bacterium]